MKTTGRIFTRTYYSIVLGEEEIKHAVFTSGGNVPPGCELYSAYVDVHGELTLLFRHTEKEKLHG